MTFLINNINQEALLDIAHFPLIVSGGTIEFDEEGVLGTKETSPGPGRGCSPGILNGAHVMIALKVYLPELLPSGDYDSLLIYNGEEWTNRTFLHKAFYQFPAKVLAHELQLAMFKSLTPPDGHSDQKVFR